MAVETIGKGGTIALPKDLLDAAQIEAGDRVRVELTEPRTLTLTLLPRPSSPDAVPPSTEAVAPPTGRLVPPENAPVDYDSLPRLTLAELLERYPIEGPVDLEADREALYDEMAKDVFGERLDRFSS